MGVCRHGQVVYGAGLALLCTFVQEARVLDLDTVHTGTGRLSQLHDHKCSNTK